MLAPDDASGKAGKAAVALTADVRYSTVITEWPHVRAELRGGSPADKQEGEWATVRLLLPRSGYAPQQKSGP